MKSELNFLREQSQFFIFSVLEGLVSYKPVNPPIFSKKDPPNYSTTSPTPTPTPTTRDWRVYALKPSVYAECTYRYEWH